MSFPMVSRRDRSCTMLEVYQAYTDYDGMAQLARMLYQTVALDVFGSTTLRLADGSESTRSAENGCRSACSARYPRCSARRSIRRWAAPSCFATRSVSDSPCILGWLPEKLVDELFEHLVGPDLRAPTS